MCVHMHFHNPFRKGPFKPRCDRSLGLDNSSNSNSNYNSNSNSNSNSNTQIIETKARQIQINITK